MLKKKAIKRILVTTLSLIIVFLICAISKVNNVTVYDDVYYINSSDTKKVYTNTKDNILAETTIYIDNKKDIEDQVKAILETMVKENDKNALLPDYFKPILPPNTKVISVELNDDILKVNFSKELMDIKEEEANKMIEAIVYTLTDYKEVLGVTIQVEGKTLKYVPNTKKAMKEVLTRDFGINKKYDINSNNDIEKIVIYYIVGDNNMYYAPVTKYINSKNEKLEVIVEELANKYEKETLKSYLNDGLKLLKYEIKENKIILNFNNKIYEGDKSTNEEALNCITYSVFATYDIDNIEIYEGQNKILEKSRKDIEN